MEKYKQVLSDSLGGILTSAVELLPKIVLGILGFIFAWIFLKITLFILKKVLKAAKIDALSEKVTKAQLLGDKEIKIDLLKIALGTVRVLLILVFTMVFAEVLGLTAISEGITSMFAYLPTFLSAVLILAGGLFLATTVKKAVLALFTSMGIGGSKAISGILFYLITFFVAITALNQAGIDTDIITSNFTMILGAFLFAAALGFGLGSREVFSDVLKMFYTRKNFAVGDKIAIEDLEGTIEAIDNITLTLKTKKGSVVLPIKDVVSKRVEIRS